MSYKIQIDKSYMYFAEWLFYVLHDVLLVSKDSHPSPYSTFHTVFSTDCITL